ncbi:MAG: deoxyribose-phosphate aldolase [Bacteroidales bacterium]
MITFPAYNTDNQRIASIIQASEELARKNVDNKDLIRSLLQFIDLTSLNGNDTRASIDKLCDLALRIPSGVAALCVYPPFAGQVRNRLKGTGIKTAAVAGAFPSGQSPIEIKTAEVAWTVAQGAQEIDMVISRGKMLEGDYEVVGAEIKAIKAACAEAHLKVILETGELESPAIIRKASEIALLSGGNFIKTSTGKINPAATPEAAVVMCETLRDYYQMTGIKAGFKPAGGIQTPQQALVYYYIVETVLGKEWLTPELFRIGASRLVNNLLETTN